MSVRGAVITQGLEVLGRNTPHGFLLDTSLAVISRREHGSPCEGKPGCVVTVGAERVQVGKHGAVDDVARVLPGNDEMTSLLLACLSFSLNVRPMAPRWLLRSHTPYVIWLRGVFCRPF